MKSKPNYAGLIDYRKSRQSGTHVGLYRAEEAGLDPDGGQYVTVCEEHNTLVNHDTLSIARSHMPYPSGWCDDCREAHYGANEGPCGTRRED